MALKTVDFVSAREGFVGGSSGALFATTDAGATWTRRSLASLGTINKLLFSTATTGWAGTSTGLYRTTNAGQTWTRVSTYDTYGYTAGGIVDIQFVTAQIGYVVGDGGLINKTTNGGTSWTSVQYRNDKNYSFQAVSFSSVDSGTVIGNEQARWLTTNGGRPDLGNVRPIQRRHALWLRHPAIQRHHLPVGHAQRVPVVHAGLAGLL
jgi:photosystem II stability/assembly factor-like uncharacterized protein